MRDAAEATQDLLSSTWSRWGTVEDDVISYLVNPSLMGGPRWPGMRQAYRVAKQGAAVLIASDGLSDPYDEGEGPDDTNGIGLELFALSDDPIARDGVGETVAQYGATWLHDLVFQVAQTAANNGTKHADLLDELGLLTMECYDVKIPPSHHERFVTEEETIGLLLTPGAGPIPPHVDGPLGKIRLVHLQLLTVPELYHCIRFGTKGRTELASRLHAQGIAPLSRLDRPSVID